MDAILFVPWLQMHVVVTSNLWVNVVVNIYFLVFFAKVIYKEHLNLHLKATSDF